MRAASFRTSMLSDEIIRHGLTLPGTDALADRVRDAVKFNMAPEFAAVCDALSMNYNNLAKALSFCRLPYKEMWIECAQKDRPDWDTPVDVPEIQSVPRRVGVLCTATREDHSAWDAHLFWVCDARGSYPTAYNVSTVKLQYDMTAIIDYAQAAAWLADHEKRNAEHAEHPLFNRGPHPGWESADERVKLEINTRCRGAPADFKIPGVPMGNKLFAELAKADWGGEVAYFLAAVAMMNSPNASERVLVDNTAYNRKRVPRGMPPLASHYLLKIHPTQAKRVRESNAASSGYRELREHYVIGHWKVRRTGIFFWRPHRRGDARRGVIEKAYEVS